MTIACLGEALIDLVPPRGVPLSAARTLAAEPGGAPMNVAIRLTRFGTDAVFAGRLSKDGLGQRLGELLQDEAVPRFPLAPAIGQTRLAVIDHFSDDAPFRFYGHTPADTELSHADVVELFARVDLSGLYVSSLLMTSPAASAVQDYAIDEAIRRTIPVYSDPNPRPAAWPSLAAMEDSTVSLLERSTLGKLSLDDARNLGWPDDPAGLLRWCALHFNAQIVVTDGPDGCWAYINGDLVHLVSPPVDAVDPTGAGDAFFSALIHRFDKNRKIREPDMRFAAAAGALATTANGALGGSMSAREVEELFNRES